MTRIRRAMIVLRAFWQLNWLEELQYRGNFIASLLGTIFWLLMAMLTVALYFRHTPQLGGWEYWDVVVLLGIFNALAGVVETVLRPAVPASMSQTYFLELELTSPDREEGTLDLDGEAAPDETGRRAIAVLRLARALAEGLEARELTDLYERVERPLVRVLRKMESAGIRMDRAFLEELRSELQDQCDDLERRIHERIQVGRRPRSACAGRQLRGDGPAGA